MWVGLTDVAQAPKGQPSVWKWTDNVTEPNDSPKWNGVEPNNAKENEHCGLFTRTARLYDEVCSKMYKGLCERPYNG